MNSRLSRASTLALVLAALVLAAPPPAPSADPSPAPEASPCPTSRCPLHALFAPRAVGKLVFLNGVRRHYANPVRFFEEFHARQGSTFKVDLPGMSLLFDARQEALAETLKNTDAGEQSWEKPPLQGHGLAFLLGMDNVFLGSGETWKEAHVVMKPYLDGRAINNDPVVARVAAILDERVNALRERIAASPGGEIEVDLRREMQLTTLDVALRMLLSARLSLDELAQAQGAFGVVMEWLTRETLNLSSVSLSRLGKLVGAGPLKQAYASLSALGDRLVAERRAAAGAPDDLLAGLLRTGFDDRRLRNEVLTILLAGHETTATLLSWTMAIMARQPDQYAKVQRAVDAFGGGVPSFEQLRKTPAIDDAIKETLRLYSPAYFLVRRATRDTTLGPPDAAVACPLRTTVVMSTYTAHRDEATWGTATTGYPADEFHPERFAHGGSKMYPFGGGARVCLGQHLARLEAALLLARYAQNFRLAPVSTAPLEPASDVSVHPSDGRVKLRLRR